MCGISAVLTLRGHTSNHTVNGDTKHILEKQLDESLKIIKHRGPDAEGQWISSDEKVGLGHVRLSIVDLSPAGNQPFHDKTTDIHAVVNGELYGHEEYRAQLKSEFKFKGNSDCEIVIALYKHYGISFLENLRGEFALVLYDARRKLFFAAKDRYGIKSLYYTVLNGRLLVATEIKQFLAFGWKPEWNVQSLKDNGWRHDERTMFRDVYKVLPGQYLISKDFEQFRLKPYWDLEYPDKNVKETRTEEEMILTVREKLIEAVRLRLRADVPVGIYLSGGLDSSSVAGITAYLMKERGEQLGSDASGDTNRLTCLSVGFDKDSGADESEIAERTAKWLGANFAPVHMNEAEIAERFEDTTWYSETVTPDANGPGKLAMAYEAHKRGIKVVLTGEGSDEHFGGYSAFRADVIREPDNSWPASHFPEERRKKVLEEAQGETFINWDHSIHDPPGSTKRMLNYTTMDRHLSKFIPLHFASWTDNGSDFDQATVIAEMIDGRTRYNIEHKWHPLHTSEYLWTKSAFPNILLRYVGDNVDMVHHVESRTPFLDHELTEYANTIPPSLKMRYDHQNNSWHEKHVLKEAMRPFITDEVYYRRKHPYLGPLMFKECGPLHKMCQRVITKDNVDLLGFLDWECVKTVVEKGWVGKDRTAIKEAFVIVQFITLAKRFGVKAATPDEIHAWK